MPHPLTQDKVSGLLRAACGSLQAPTTEGTQIFALTAEGTWCTKQGHHLELVTAGDLRALAGSPEVDTAAPLRLLYVIDLARLEGSTRGEWAFLASADAGTILENVHLYCADKGLAISVHGLVDRQRLTDALDLQPTQRIVLVQSVGYPGEGAQ